MKAILILIAAALLFILGMRYIEENSLFFPMKKITMRPDEFGLEYEDIYKERKIPAKELILYGESLFQDKKR